MATAAFDKSELVKCASRRGNLLFPRCINVKQLPAMQIEHLDKFIVQALLACFVIISVKRSSRGPGSDSPWLLSPLILSLAAFSSK